MEDLFGKCPYVTSQKLLAGKWSMLILHYLSESGSLRFGELLRMLPDLTQATLTKHLRCLEKDGLVNRKVYPEVPPRVVYSLTEMGKGFEPVLDAYEAFGEQYIGFLKERETAAK
ncbi:helix-turn-helix transcriptional regulator [Christensenellaceae bacterium OttesenSCG-928-M15]|nr:helix-turn-helix transcriptional regulator [Christensenellaceae bacterium OttesenSCG-928-M15]